MRTGPVAARALAIDALLVLGFAALGRRNHAEGVTVGGVLATAAPFLTGLAVAWPAVRAWRAPLAPWPTGVVLSVVTVVVGMAVRRLTGAGTAVAFVVVATLFLAITLVGWRLVAGTLARRRA